MKGDHGRTTNIVTARGPEEEAREPNRRAGRRDRDRANRRSPAPARPRARDAAGAAGATVRPARRAQRANRSRIRQRREQRAPTLARSCATTGASSRARSAFSQESRRWRCQAASFSANGRVYAGDDDGSTSVEYPASRHIGSARAAVWPLKQTSARTGAARRTRAASPGVASRIAPSRLPCRRHATIASQRPMPLARNATRRRR